MPNAQRACVVNNVVQDVLLTTVRSRAYELGCAQTTYRIDNTGECMACGWTSRLPLSGGRFARRPNGPSSEVVLQGKTVTNPEAAAGVQRR